LDPDSKKYLPELTVLDTMDIAYVCQESWIWKTLPALSILQPKEPEPTHWGRKKICSSHCHSAQPLRDKAHILSLLGDE
jgi:hypothetical protein